MTAIAPGKLILCGEHAVVYNAPAIALAVNRYATATVERHTASRVGFNLLNIHYHKDHTVKALKTLKRQLLKNYDAFQQGQKSIKDVLKLPMELTQFAITNLLDKLNHTLTEGLQLKTHSDIPMGCGMGSSAASILVATRAMADHLRIELSEDLYLRYSLEAENLQHGQSSGLDLKVCYRGGCVFFHNHEWEALPPPTFPLYMVNTGVPESSTGECVSHVKSRMKDHVLEEFSQVAFSLKDALLQNDESQFKEAIKKNHDLLVDLELVPSPIQAFIRTLEAQGFAAKICGAGTCRGNSAGMMLIAGPEDPQSLCKDYGFQSELIECDTKGLRTLS